MCTTCGCGENSQPKLIDPKTGNVVSIDLHAPQAQDREPAHQHGHEASHAKTIHLEAEILAKNDRIAERNRKRFAEENILALNLVSSPGSGKTTLLERTIRDLGNRTPLLVIEGDQETDNDAKRIRATGCRVVQVNTGAGCHLEADMVARGLQALMPPRNSLVMIENVGNLVCPALFDLGEKCKVVILSVTEGEDKPIKYPHMFRASDIMILNKIDLLPYVQFSSEKCIKYARQVNPGIRVFEVSATTGEGMTAWTRWLKEQMAFNESDPSGRKFDQISTDGIQA
jgi:hydrogenase nickel incorporation protein HypB